MGFQVERERNHRKIGIALLLQELRVNWAFQKEQTEDTSAHFHIFVGDLSAEINDFSLRQAFDAYSECSDARVLWDHLTGRSKGYGFVSFRYRARLAASAHICPPNSLCWQSVFTSGSS